MSQAPIGGERTLSRRARRKRRAKQREALSNPPLDMEALAHKHWRKAQKHAKRLAELARPEGLPLRWI
jgi:hypothetical protein